MDSENCLIFNLPTVRGISLTPPLYHKCDVTDYG